MLYSKAQTNIVRVDERALRVLRNVLGELEIHVEHCADHLSDAKKLAHHSFEAVGAARLRSSQLELYAESRPDSMGKQRIKANYRRRVLKLPDLNHCKLAVLNSLGSPASRRVYDYAIDQFIAWYCSEPRLAFNRIVVVRYRMHLESRGLASNTINQQLAVRRLAHEAADSGLLSPELA